MRQPSRLDNLRFTQAMLRELRQLMTADVEHLLTYLLDMAYLEASDRARSAWVADARSEEHRLGEVSARSLATLFKNRSA